ncbi:sulfite exporter TauE/SafE family protein [Actinoplanes derwentensis]|nr:TSUP family transporter [Actinoplanes derwentensis]
MVAAFAAGWIDAVVGGGGLLLLPALLVAAPQLHPATALGTNKLAAICGTSTAAVAYARKTTIDWGVAGPAAGLALLCAGCGAALAGAIPASAYRPVIIAVLILVAVFVTVRPQMGLIEQPHKRTAWRRGTAVAVAGAGIAAYDGLIGPGTGTFLVLAFTTLIGADFVHGSAMAKIVNTATNLGALVVFAATGHVAWLLGAAMAVCNVGGALLGARMALRRGAGFVRIILLTVVLALIARLGWLVWQDS